MKILHTSDWHIGKVLYSKKRYDEFEKFLSWMIDTINDQKIDILLISGDIFDTSTPSNRSVELYFNFLNSVAKNSSCKHVVITAGNHDSPSFLEAPKMILKSLNTYIVARIDDIKDEVLKLCVGDEEIIVCAVPYLRDRDLRESAFGESIEDKEQKIVNAIKKHYKDVAEYAKSLQDKSQKIIALGHMFVAGENTKVGDGVRELYVGSLGYVGIDIFDDSFDYVALGHLHIPQYVAKTNHIRYSGSPFAMGFNEAKQKKSVTILDINDDDIKTEILEVPTFQKLVQIKGDLLYIKDSLQTIIKEDRSIWVEIIYEGKEIVSDLNTMIQDMVDETKVEVLRIKSKTYIKRALSKSKECVSLEDMDLYEVFDKCLELNEIEDKQKDELKALYKEIVKDIQEQS